MQKCLAWIVVVSLVLGSSLPASGQSLLPIKVDQRVRIWTASAEATTGRVAAVPRDTIQIDVDGRDRETVAAITIRKVEISGGGGSRGDGASVGEAVVLGLWSGALFGGAIGAAVGAARAAEKWTQVFP